MEKVNQEKKEKEFIEKIVNINRVAKVVKGGKRFGFSTLIVVGDGNGRVGVAIGKANDVRSSVEKGISKAKENMVKVQLTEDYTIPHTIIGRFGAGKIILKPAGPGTGVLAGGPARAVLTAVGVKNILTKCLRTRNPLNVVYATIDGLKKLKTREYIAQIRGKSAEKL
ncbi:MAG: 30S ribosomal protein S5 [Elusimicrobia bacterium]|nr:30S ribosomal protein S5 [Elusimicrobiota bacterium]